MVSRSPWISIFAFLCLFSSLHHLAQADSSSDSSEENSTELRPNVHSLKDREQVVGNDPAKELKQSSKPEGAKNNTASSQNEQHQVPAVTDAPQELPLPADPNDQEADKLAGLITLKSEFSGSRSSYKDAEVVVQSEVDPEVSKKDAAVDGKELEKVESEVSFRGGQDGVFAVAQMLQAGGAEAGNVVFHQGLPLQAVRVLGSVVLAAAPTAVKVEIHTNADVTNSCLNVGRIYNPFGVSDGGVILRSGATNQDVYVSFFKEDRNILQLTLYGDSKVIGRSVVIYNQADAPVACGIIRESTTLL